MKVALAATSLKMLEEQWKVEFHSSLYFDASRCSAWGNITETIIVPGLPDNKLTDIKNINKDTRGSSQFIRTKTKENVMTKNNRTHRRKREHERLEPTQNTLNKGTREK